MAVDKSGSQLSAITSGFDARAKPGAGKRVPASNSHEGRRNVAAPPAIGRLEFCGEEGISEGSTFGAAARRSASASCRISQTYAAN